MPIDISKLPLPIAETIESLSSRYVFTEENEEGGNGYVFMCRNNLLDTNCVVKFYSWEGEERYHLEPKALTEFDSPHVLKVLDAGIADNSWAYFVTPQCAEGSLDTKINSHSISNLQSFELVSGILDGLIYLHSRRYIHRDLKPSNIYIHEGRAVIGDFGSLVRLPDAAAEIRASRHSVLYRPPESVDHDTYGFMGDIYQVGLVLYQMLGGKLPHHETDALNARQLKEYKRLSYPDNTIYADTCLKTRISKGRLADFGSVNCWAAKDLVAAARKATRVTPGQRFNSAADFLAKISGCRSSIPDWRMDDDGNLILGGSTEYRVCPLTLAVQKRKSSSAWRNDYSHQNETLAEVVRSVQTK